MDPTTLVGPTSPLGYPSPYWFLVAFKVLGFALHMVPMNLWYAGIILAMLFHWRGGGHARRWSRRLMNQMPIIIALGINFGIVPLLFMQVAYYRAFYTATILMAWPWFSIIFLLTVAYYGVYYYVVGLRRHEAGMTPLRRAIGWLAAFLFLVIGFTFANGLSLTANPSGWAALWEGSNTGGATLGTGLNTADPTLWPRWLMMFGLALTTTAAYTVVDAAFFAGKESGAYRQWAAGVAPRLYTVGLVWFAVTASWYVFGTWSSEVRQTMFSGPQLILSALTAAGIGLPWLLVLAQREGVSRRLAFVTGLAQFGVLGFNAISRQIVQNAELIPVMDVTAEPVNVQWSPLILFLVLFVVGLAVIAWIVSKVVEAERRPAATM